MKKKLVILGALALTAAAAVPALAFESEFHGMYRLRAMLTNFEDAGLTGTNTVIVPGKQNTNLLSTSSQNRAFTLFEQRARLQYIGKANDDLKLVTHFEIDSTWGDAAFQNGRGQGGGLGADTVNLETKSVYLDFNIPSTPVNVKLGIQPFTDAYKGIFLNDDVGGAVASAKFGPATATAAFFRTYDAGGTTALGKQNVDLYVVDAKIAPIKAITLGASYYLANNDVNYSGQQTHTFGVNAAAKLGIVDLDAFLLYQGGDELYAKTGKDLEAFAGQVAAKVNLGVVAVRAAGIYASGDDGRNGGKSHVFQSLWDAGAPTVAPKPGTSPASNYYSSNMLLLLRSSFAMDSDQALVTSVNNGDAGLVAAFVGADLKVNDKLSANFNLGHAMVDKRNEAAWGVSATSRSTNKNIGTELNTSVNYALYPNLTATAQGAYVFLGGYKKLNNGDLRNPYLAGLMMNYTF